MPLPRVTSLGSLRGRRRSPSPAARSVGSRQSQQSSQQSRRRQTRNRSRGLSPSLSVSSLRDRLRRKNRSPSPHFQQRRRRHQQQEQNNNDPQQSTDTDASTTQRSSRVVSFSNVVQQHTIPSSSSSSNMATTLQQNQLFLGPSTTLHDLQTFVESDEGSFALLLPQLTTPRLQGFATRLLADYAKHPPHRVAMAQPDAGIIQFLVVDILQQTNTLGSASEYAVETIRSLTATEATDALLLQHAPALLVTLADTAVHATDKARLHACIALMNLSCGKANKTTIANQPRVLAALIKVLLSGTDEARLKAMACIKNLSNTDANDAALLKAPGLLTAVARTAAMTCQSGATACTTHACLALMNLSIAKPNKQTVFTAPSVMESLLDVLEWTSMSSKTTTGTQRGKHNSDARIRACSALSNLAIGYENKVPMFRFLGLIRTVLNVIANDEGDARTKCCSILWSLAAERQNQIPMVERGDIVPLLVQVAKHDTTTGARSKSLAALTLLAESQDNALPLLREGALEAVMEILMDAGADPANWKRQTASWSLGFVMNVAQSDEAVPILRRAGVVELLTPLVGADHYQSLKAAMAVAFCGRFDQQDEGGTGQESVHSILDRSGNAIPKIVQLLHNTLAGLGGSGYKYGVFTLRSSVGCIATLAEGPSFIQEQVANESVVRDLLRVLRDYAIVQSPSTIVGGGKDDIDSAILACKALSSLMFYHLAQTDKDLTFSLDTNLQRDLVTALDRFATKVRPNDDDGSLYDLAISTRHQVLMDAARRSNEVFSQRITGQEETIESPVSEVDHSFGRDGPATTTTSPNVVTTYPHQSTHRKLLMKGPKGTFSLKDPVSRLVFMVPVDPVGGRSFNDRRKWCYKRGRFCYDGEVPDPAYTWNSELHLKYHQALASGTVESIEESPEDDEEYEV